VSDSGAGNGRSLVNLVAELELRLTGDSPVAGLDPLVGTQIPTASSYLLVVFDGLGDLQLDHPAARPLLASRRQGLRAPFPTTTSVSLASIATGQTVGAHGLVAHLMWLPELSRVVNTLKWVDLSGAPVAHDTGSFLPAPNLWERLRAQGVEPVTIQPEDFATTPLTAALYRGSRFVGYRSADEFVERSLRAVAIPRRLVLAYWPPVDVAGHVFGLDSPEYEGALASASAVWQAIARSLPTGSALLGTADHGIVPVPESGKHLVRGDTYRPLVFWGDPRAVMVRGSVRLIHRLRAETGAELLEAESIRAMMGTGPSHPQLSQRLPTAALLAPDNTVILPPGFDKRLAGYHGGLSEEEVAIPLLVEA
jgi:hypothetical protein